MDDTEREALAVEMMERFARDPNDPLAILADAALHYNSTDAHNARCVRAALDAIREQAT